ncbi:MAG: hypothetical protein ACTSU9_11460 [Promethearchaeota archaeon]
MDAANDNVFTSSRRSRNEFHATIKKACKGGCIHNPRCHRNNEDVKT